MCPVPGIGLYCESSIASTDGTQPDDCSVSASLRPGWRENTLPKSMCQNTRCEYQLNSMMNTAGVAG